jgi:hypothetical protein
MSALGISVSMVVPSGYSIVPLTMLVFGAWALATKRWQREKTNFTMAAVLTCFAFYAVGSAALSAIHRDPPGHFEQYLPFVGATLMAVAFQAYSLNCNQLIGGFAVAAVLAAIVSIVQVVQAEGPHRASLFGTVNTFGMIGALYGLVCASALGWTAHQGCRRWRVLLVCGSMGGLTVALLSGSQGCYGFLVSNLPHSPVVSRVQGFTQQGDSFRETYWKAGLGMIKINPLIGVGREEIYRQLVELTTRRYGSPLPTVATRELHNEYLDILVARGVLGWVLTLSTLLVPLVLLARRAKSGDPASREVAVTGILFIMAFAICGLTDVQFQINAKRMTYVLGVVLFVHFASRKTSDGAGLRH